MNVFALVCVVLEQHQSLDRAGKRNFLDLVVTLATCARELPLVVNHAQSRQPRAPVDRLSHFKAPAYELRTCVPVCLRATCVCVFVPGTQAYTGELEADVARLRRENVILRQRLHAMQKQLQLQASVIP